MFEPTFHLLNNRILIRIRESCLASHDTRLLSQVCTGNVCGNFRSNDMRWRCPNNNEHTLSDDATRAYNFRRRIEREEQRISRQIMTSRL